MSSKYKPKLQDRQGLDSLVSKIFFVLLFVVLEIIALIIIVNRNEYHTSSYINSSNVVSAALYKNTSYARDFAKYNAYNSQLRADMDSLMRLKEITYYKYIDSLSLDTNGLDGIVDTVVVFEEDYNFLRARVIRNTVNKRYNYLTIDKGSRDGFKKGMAIVAPTGIVGIVAATSANYSVVISVLNIKASVSVKHKRTGDVGILKWKGPSFQSNKINFKKQPILLNVEDLNKYSNTKVGDTIITSGFSFSFPPDYPVGVITELIDSTNFLQLKLAPFNDIGSSYLVYGVQHKDIAEIDSLENLIE